MAIYIDDSLAVRAASEPDGLLIECGERRWTYAQIDTLATRGARWLVKTGVAPGDRVLVLGDNSDGFAIAVLAALRAGAIFVPVSSIGAAAVLPAVVAASAPRVVLADADMLSTYRTQLSGIASRDFAALLADSDGGTAAPAIPERSDAACIIFTSGSTATPRGVVCTHSAIIAAARAINAVLGQGEADRILCALPFSFDYGLYQLFLAIECGASIVIVSLASPAIALPGLLARRSVSIFPIVPALAALLLRSRLLERTPFPSLRLVTNTGDLLPQSLQHRLKTLLPDAAITPMYGLTECKRVAVLPSDRAAEAPRGSVGLPLPGTAVSLQPLDAAGGPEGDWGELHVTGPHIMAGYWQDAAATSARFFTDPRSGARTLRSGDVFSRDRRGFLTYLGRAEALGEWGGRWVFPGALEDSLAALPGVDQAAIVVSRECGKVTAIGAFLSTLAPSERVEREARAIIAETCLDPPGVFIRSAKKLPYTTNGKIDRIALASRAPQ